jgi:hypothetical protein
MKLSISRTRNSYYTYLKDGQHTKSFCQTSLFTQYTSGTQRKVKLDWGMGTIYVPHALSSPH